MGIPAGKHSPQRGKSVTFFLRRKRNGKLFSLYCVGSTVGTCADTPSYSVTLRFATGVRFPLPKVGGGNPRCDASALATAVGKRERCWPCSFGTVVRWVATNYTRILPPPTAMLMHSPARLRFLPSMLSNDTCLFVCSLYLSCTFSTVHRSCLRWSRYTSNLWLSVKNRTYAYGMEFESGRVGGARRTTLLRRPLIPTKHLSFSDSADDFPLVAKEQKNSLKECRRKAQRNTPRLTIDINHHSSFS